MALVSNRRRDPDEDHYTFKSCGGFKKDPDTGETKWCNYATTDMTETHCPKCDGRLMEDY